MDGDYVASVRADAARVAELLWADPTVIARRVPACPGWSVRDVVEHLGGVHRMVVEAVTTRRPSHFSRHQPDHVMPCTALGQWLAEGAEAMCEVLSQDVAAGKPWKR